MPTTDIRSYSDLNPEEIDRIIYEYAYANKKDESRKQIIQNFLRIFTYISIATVLTLSIYFLITSIKGKMSNQKTPKDTVQLNRRI
jgi:hypothetical protein